MANLKQIGLVFFLSVLMNPVAYGDYFKCGFTEPFFNVYISTSAQFVTLNVFSDEHASRQIDILNSVDKDGVLTLTLSDQQNFKIHWNTPGSDGMSDLNYPYEATYMGLYGGCSRETNYVEYYNGKVYSESIIERWKSWASAAGASFVDSWLGEGSALASYKVLKDITLPSGSTWKSLDHSRKDALTCSLSEGKVISPASKKPNEVFGTLSFAMRVPADKDYPGLSANKGDMLTVVAQQGEGFCLVEKDGKMESLECYQMEFPVVGDGGYHDVPTNGYYAFTQCKEGHYTWVPISELDKLGNDIQYTSGF